MDIFEQLDPQAILVLLMVIFAAIKAFFEQRKKVGSEETLEEETNLDLYQAYEEEVARQRKELQIELSPPASPPLLSDAIPFSSANATLPPPLPSEPVLPKLSAAEKKALNDLNLRKKTRSRKSRESTKSRIYRHLSSPTAAREALLLAEILGPPKANQEKF